ncbi:MAG TPA: hypothetical protein VFS08_02300 [Gemmatimonadaceae bacterium]|nr:hypothetical protein [Gemmatimonadaceae bacterium]
MSNELKFPVGGRDGRDEELAQLLRPLYAAPTDEQYWEGLHARILRRVSAAAIGDGGEWWVVLSRWSRIGAAAAVMAAALAGALWLQHRATEARLAYDAMLSAPVYSMQFDDVAPRDPVPGARSARPDVP